MDQRNPKPGRALLVMLLWPLVWIGCIALILLNGNTELVTSEHKNWERIGAIGIFGITLVSLMPLIFAREELGPKRLSGSKVAVFVTLMLLASAGLGGLAGQAIANHWAFRNSTAQTRIEYGQIDHVDRHKGRQLVFVRTRYNATAISLPVSGYEYRRLKGLQADDLASLCYPVMIQQQGGNVRAIKAQPVAMAAVRYCGPDQR
jgi:hypothetical protein